MANFPTTDLAAHSDEELRQALARVDALAHREVLNDAEVQQFWQLYDEILRRSSLSGTAVTPETALLGRHSLVQTKALGRNI